MQTQLINLFGQMHFCSEKKQELLTDFTVANKLPVPNFNRHLGAGMFGDVWECEDGIHTFKTTTSQREAKVMNWLIDNTHPGLVDVVKVVKYKPAEFAIWKKKVDLVDTKMREILKAQPKSEKYLRFLSTVNQVAHEETKAQKTTFMKKWEGLPLVAGFVETMIKTIERGIYLYDFHNGNFGIDKAGKQVTAFDFAFDGVIKGKVPTLN